MEYYLALSSMLQNFAFTTLSQSMHKTYKLNSKVAAKLYTQEALRPNVILLVPSLLAFSLQM